MALTFAATRPMVATPVYTGLESYINAPGVAMEADADDLSLLGTLHIDRGVEEQVTEIMKLLAATGQHRAPSIADLFVAAVAGTRNATVLHYDKDFELIADVTGQRQEWVIPRGTGHGRH